MSINQALLEHSSAHQSQKVGGCFYLFIYFFCGWGEVFQCSVVKTPLDKFQKICPTLWLLLYSNK